LKRAKIPPVPKSNPQWRPMTGTEIKNMLLTDGFKRTDAATKKRLLAGGNWGMPDE